MVFVLFVLGFELVGFLVAKAETGAVAAEKKFEEKLIAAGVVVA